MYVEHPFLKQPADSDRLWRYMQPTIFLSMLLRRAVHLPPLACFEDPYEGVPPRAVVDQMRRQRDQGHAEAPEGLDAWRRMIELARTNICANSWHIGEEESEAMWRLYGRYEDGLAIVSRMPAIRDAFRDHNVTGGCVDYSGREFKPGTTEQNLLQWATTKRPSYEYEKEFRVLVHRDRGNDDELAGVSLGIDPHRLIEEVVLSPRMQRWQIDLFRALFERLEFARPVRESSLTSSPF
jgi:DUF2971 family protein